MNFDLNFRSRDSALQTQHELFIRWIQTAHISSDREQCFHQAALTACELARQNNMDIHIRFDEGRSGLIHLEADLLILDRSEPLTLLAELFAQAKGASVHSSRNLVILNFHY